MLFFINLTLFSSISSNISISFKILFKFLTTFCLYIFIEKLESSVSKISFNNSIGINSDIKSYKFIFFNTIFLIILIVILSLIRLNSPLIS